MIAADANCTDDYRFRLWSIHTVQARLLKNIRKNAGTIKEANAIQYLASAP